MKLFLISIILFPLTGFAQPYETNPDYKRTNNWLFGNNAWLDFNYNPPQNKDGSQLSAVEPSTSYSDEDGNLLLYSDGLTIWNGNHNVIINGTNIDGHWSSSQGAVFVKIPNNDSLVYFFTTDQQCNNKGFKYSIILLHADMDSISVLEKNNPIISDVAETIAVTQHQNKNDYWVVVRKSYGKEFFSFLLTAEGLVKCPIISISDRNTDGSSNKCQTKSKFNDKGSKYAFVSPLDGDIELYSFDNSKGTLDNFSFIDNLNIPSGVEFTANDSFLYFLERDFHVRRLNIYSGLYDTIYSTPNSAFLMVEMLRSNSNKIYINIPNSDTLAIIRDLGKESPIFTLKGQGTNNKGLTNGLPNFNQSYYYTPSTNIAVKLNCVQNTIQFYGQDTFQANTHNWEITKQGITMTENIKNPLIEFTDTGVYNVRYIASNGSRSDTVSKEVTILLKIQNDFLGNDTGWCNAIGAPITLQAPSGMHCYEWNTGETGSLITADTPGIYSVKITTPNFCVLYDTISIEIDSIPEKPIIYQHHDTLKTDAIAKGYQWFKNNQPVGENNKYLKITDTGIYYLISTSDIGCSSVSDTLQVHRVGINNIEKLMIKIYPNPFDDELVIESKEKSEIQITVYNSIGEEVFTTITNDNIFKINTSQWKQGVYFIEATHSSGIKQTIKVIK